MVSNRGALMSAATGNDTIKMPVGNSSASHSEVGTKA